MKVVIESFALSPYYPRVEPSDGEFDTSPPVAYTPRTYVFGI